MASPLRLAFRKRGFLGPLDSGLDVGPALRELEALGGAGRVAGDLRFKAHLLAPALFDLVRAPAVVEPVAEALGLGEGEALLARSSDLNIKAGGSGGFFSWHQDGRYANAEPPGEAVTVWLALTASKRRSGCLRFLPAAPESTELLPHEVSAERANMLSRGQTIPERELRTLLSGGDGGVEEASVAMELEPGQFSVHSFLSPHRSGPNEEVEHERVGLAVRYVSARVRVAGARSRESALLVRGSLPEGYGEFDVALEERPRETGGAEERRRHAAAVALENANYFADNPVRSGYHV